MFPVSPFILQMWSSLRRYGRWGEALGHLINAEKEMLRAMTAVIRSLREATAPFVRDDALAAFSHEVFKFIERGIEAMSPSRIIESPKLRDTERRALLAIRDVLLEERAAVTADPARVQQRAEVIDSILHVLDNELRRISDDPEEHRAAEGDEDAAPESDRPAMSDDHESSYA